MSLLSPLELESVPPEALTEVEFAENPGTFPRVDFPISVQLEARGVTSHHEPYRNKARSPQSQAEFWHAATVHKQSVAAKLRQAGETALADELEYCHSTFTVVECLNCGHTRHYPNRCDKKYCPECQPRLTWDRQRGIEWWTREINQPKHLVVTIHNIPDLTREHVLEFKKWWARLRRRKFARGWRGGLYNIEVTNEGRGWHLHLHALIDASFIDGGQLAREWNSITSGWGHIVKVRDARGEQYLHEITKYCVKPAQLAKWTPDQIITFIRAFDEVRTFGVFGTLYGKRTEYAEWIKSVRDAKPLCSCPSPNMRYWSEVEWATMPQSQAPVLRPRPPNASKQNELAISITTNWTP